MGRFNGRPFSVFHYNQMISLRVTHFSVRLINNREMENQWKEPVNIRQGPLARGSDCQLVCTGPSPDLKPFTTVPLKREGWGRKADREEKGNVWRESLAEKAAGVEKAWKQILKQKVQIYNSTRKHYTILFETPCLMTWAVGGNWRIFKDNCLD